LEAAEAWLREALVLRPGAIHSRLALAELLDQRGLENEALAEYARSVDLVPDDAGVYIAYAGALYRHARQEEAITQLRRALEIAPSLGTLEELLAEIRQTTAEEPGSGPAHEQQSAPSVPLYVVRPVPPGPGTSASAPSTAISMAGASSPGSLLQPIAPADTSSAAPVPEEPELLIRSVTMVTETPTPESELEEESQSKPEAGDVLPTDSPGKSGGRKGRRRNEASVPAAERTRKPSWFVRLFHWGQ
jgi:tetratricopeptide (TPR) repeat protein